MLIKLNENWYVSKLAIREVYVEQGDDKTVRLVGDSFKSLAVFGTVAKADACLIDVVTKLNNTQLDLSMYDWK